MNHSFCIHPCLHSSRNIPCFWQAHECSTGRLWGVQEDETKIKDRREGREKDVRVGVTERRTFSVHDSWRSTSARRKSAHHKFLFRPAVSKCQKQMSQWLCLIMKAPYDSSWWMCNLPWTILCNFFSCSFIPYQQHCMSCCNYRETHDLRCMKLWPEILINNQKAN